MDMLDYTREEVEEAVRKLRYTDLAGIDLSGADLRRANLREAELRAAKYNKSTKFPDGFDPKVAGIVLAEYE